MDNLSPIKRSWNMSLIKSKNTNPEKVVRSLLHRMGYRFRLHRNDLPGKPDIVLTKYKTVIFVHGCFWHRHKDCRRAFTPKSNRRFWNDKFDKNVSRDKKSKAQLIKTKWKVITIWGCRTKEILELSKELKNRIEKIN